MKERWLATLPDYTVHSYDVQEQLIDVDDDIAAVLQRAQMHATVGGVDRSGVFIVTDIWRRRDGQVTGLEAALDAAHGRPGTDCQAIDVSGT